VRGLGLTRCWSRTRFYLSHAALSYLEMGMHAPSYVPMVLAVAGLVVSFAWWAAVSRGFRYQLRYVDFAKALEAKFPGDEFKILTDGAKTHMCFPATVRTRTTLHIVIGVFVVLYVAALGYAVYAALVWRSQDRQRPKGMSRPLESFR